MLVTDVELASEAYWQDNPAIRRVVQRRSQILKADRPFGPEECPETAVRGGRLLVCNYAASDACEASLGASRGFFDVCDVPPWDTWVDVFEPSEPAHPWVGWLVSWVPAVFVSLAQAGIEVNPCDVVFWADRRFNPPELNWTLDRADLPEWVTNWPETAGWAADEGVS